MSSKHAFIKKVMATRECERKDQKKENGRVLGKLEKFLRALRVLNEL